MGKGYEDLMVWRRSTDLAIEIYGASSAETFRRDWAFRDQVRRAALSVPSNIAEGAARGSDRDCARFFLIARGSIAELSTQLRIASAVGMMAPDSARRWRTECDEIGRMLNALIERRRTAAESSSA